MSESRRQNIPSSVPTPHTQNIVRSSSLEAAESGGEGTWVTIVSISLTTLIPSDLYPFCSPFRTGDRGDSVNGDSERR